jgi:hypothetical protein
MAFAPDAGANMITRRTLAGLLAAFRVATATRALADVPATTSRRPEIQTLVRFAETTHPEGLRAAQDPHWQTRARNLVDHADSMDDARYVVETLRLLSWFRDGHTGLVMADYKHGIWGLRLPVRAEVFYDGAFITAAKAEALPLLGGRIMRVAGVRTEEIMRRFAQIWPANNAAGTHRWANLLFSSPGFLHGLGIFEGPIDAPVAIECAMPHGGTLSVAVTPQPDGAEGRQPLAIKPSELAAHAATRNFGPKPDPTEDGRNYVWPRDDAIYVSLDRMNNDDFSKPFSVFENEFNAALDASKARRLIIDLRRNGGGNNFFGEPLRHRINRSRFNAPGGVYVLIAPHTFSAAQNLTTRLERETFAVFVGEPTGASPNHCGDAQRIQIGNSPPARVSTLRWMDSPPLDHRQWIMPDLMAPATYADYLAGRDPAFEIALSHHDNRANDDGLLTAPWDRPSQQQTWRPFWV